MHACKHSAWRRRDEPDSGREGAASPIRNIVQGTKGIYEYPYCIAHPCASLARRYCYLSSVKKVDTAQIAGRVLVHARSVKAGLLVHMSAGHTGVT